MVYGNSENLRIFGASYTDKQTWIPNTFNYGYELNH